LERVVAAVSSDERRAVTIIRIAGAVVLALMIVFLAILPSRPVHENLPGVQNPLLGFELASRPEHVFGILGRPGEAARADAVRRTDLGNRIDFLFMIAYPLLFVGIGLLLRAHGSLSRGAQQALVALAVLMWLGDLLENRELLFLSGTGDPAAMAPSLARLQVFTRVKWYAIFVAAALLAVGAWRERGWWRWSAPFYALAALCGAVSLAYLPAIESGMLALSVGWIIAYVRAWRAPA
jgi:hypothetical protein